MRIDLQNHPAEVQGPNRSTNRS